MRANNLTISVPYKGCDKACPYCVSKCTGFVKEDRNLMLRNIPKVLTMARLGQVSSVMITGKGEPCLNFNDILLFCDEFQEFPLELQTNGIYLSENMNDIGILANHSMNVIAISVDDFGGTPIELLSEKIHDNGMLLRMTFNVTNNTYAGKDVTFPMLLDYCVKHGVDQLTIRNIVAPNYVEETAQTKWINEKVDHDLYMKIMMEMDKTCKESGHRIRILPQRSVVYDIKGVSISYSNYCIQDENDTDDIRSLIFQEDGHMYTSWNSNASKLF